MKDNFIKLLNKIRNSIKIKIIFIYVMSLIAVYIITWWVLSVFLFQPLERERERSMTYNSEKVVNDIRRLSENYDNVLYLLSNNHIIYDSLSDQCKNYEQVWEALTDIKYTLREDLARSSVIKRLEIYQQGSDIGQDGKFVFADEFDETMLKNTDWAEETIDHTVLLCKYQKISYLYHDVKAYLKIAIKSQEAFGEALILERDMSGTVFLSNEEGIIIASSQTASVGESINSILSEDGQGFQNGQILEDGKLMIMKSQVNDLWNVWLLVSSSRFDAQVNNSKFIAGFILLWYGAVSGIVLSLLLSKVFGRLHKLGENMEQIQGDISYIMIPEKHDEVTVLEIKYNSMLKKLENVVDEMAEVRSQKQRFEFKSLESQINPHFLYNTLGVMRWEALECGSQKLVAMIDDLTAFYRLSLNKGRGLLSVEKEMKLVQAYINIQQMRWDNVVDVGINMNPNVKEIIIPKMILQPLVENIWLHGNITAEGNRRVEINVLDSNDKIELKIWDNGDGIPEEIIHKFNLNREIEGDSFGIGIQFIRNILRYYYGDDFVYEVTSNNQSGTLVRIELPKEMGVIT